MITTVVLAYQVKKVIINIIKTVKEKGRKFSYIQNLIVTLIIRYDIELSTLLIDKKNLFWRK